MPLKPELQEIVDEMEFDTPEERTSFEKLMEGKAGTKISAGYMKAKDYTTKTQALSAAKSALEKQQTEFSEGQNYLASQNNIWKTDLEKRLNDSLKQVSNSTLRGAALETKLRALAAQYGEDPEELLADVKEQRAEEKKPAVAAYDDEEFKKRFIPRDEFKTAADAVFAFAPQIRDFEREYARTFGKEYEGSITELVNDASRAVSERRSRGQQADLFGYIKEKLDFSGQTQRNQETSKTQAAEERKTWETKTREEIERNVRTELYASNPSMATPPDKSNEWRSNLGAKARGAQPASSPAPLAANPMDQFKHRQNIHKTYEELASKRGAA